MAFDSVLRDSAVSCNQRIVGAGSTYYGGGVYAAGAAGYEGLGSNCVISCNTNDGWHGARLPHRAQP
jgi:hypothetical protein